MRLNSCWHADGSQDPDVCESAVASRNRLLSGAALLLALAGCTLWSVLVLHLPAAGLRYSSNQLYWLAALPALSGATLLLFVHAFALPAFGARRWTAIGAGGLLLTALGVAWALRGPDTAFETMVALALCCGTAGGLVASTRLQGASISAGEQAVIVRNRHNGLMSWLALGSLGSLLGLALALPLFAQQQFAPAEALTAALWAGPLLGVPAWALGGRLADRFGAARVTFWAFAAMVLGVVAWWFALPDGFGLFLGASAWLFTACGIGSGSTGRMFARVFVVPKQAGAALGFAGAVAAYGGFVVPKALGTSLWLSDSVAPALLAFAAFYLSCLAITWWHYGRRFAPTPC